MTEAQNAPVIDAQNAHLAAAPFRCPNLRAGEVCHPTTPPHFLVRFVCALTGTCIPIAAPAVKFMQSWTGPNVPATVVSMVLAAVFSMTYTLSHETEKVACFITALGIPGLCTVLVNFASL
jgi:hypothetical protein